MISNHQNSYPPPARLSFPFDESKDEWLPMLLDCYFTADRGVYEGIRRQIAKGRKLACNKGCSHCCRSHTSIPVYPLEIVGIYWYAIQKLEKKQQLQLKQSLLEHRKGGSCPFLVDGICAIHPMRFLACRHFNVFDTVCAKGEDAFHTRRSDVLTPIKKHQDEALSKMLPFHGIKKKADRRNAIKTGWIHQHVQVLQEIDWSRLAARLP